MEEKPTDPNADADDHGDPGRAVAERLERVHGDVAAVAAHGCQGDARGLHRHLGGISTALPNVCPSVLTFLICAPPPCTHFFFFFFDWTQMNTHELLSVLDCLLINQAKESVSSFCHNLLLMLLGARNELNI